MAGYRAPQQEHAAILVRQADLATWTPDTVVSVSLSPSWSISDHPVEDGVTVSDHIQRQPAAMTITCVVTENPVAVGGVTGGRTHVREKLAWLLDTANAGQLVDVVTTRLGTFIGYAIQSAPHTIDNVARLQFDLALREVRVATSNTVQIDRVAEPSAAPEVNVGEQTWKMGGMVGADDEAAEEADQSVLASMLDWL